MKKIRHILSARDMVGHEFYDRINLSLAKTASLKGEQSKQNTITPTSELVLLSDIEILEMESELKNSNLSPEKYAKKEKRYNLFKKLVSRLKHFRYVDLWTNVETAIHHRKKQHDVKRVVIIIDLQPDPKGKKAYQIQFI